MARVSPVQTNFTAGEISPRLYGRVDVAKYKNAVESLLNYKVMPHGGITRREGTHYVSTAKNDDCVLIPFEFNVEQTYIIEAGVSYMRFYYDRGQVAGPYEIATSYSGTTYQSLDWAQSEDVMYLVQADTAPQKLTRTGHSAWTITDVTFLDGPYLDQNTTAITITPSVTTGSGTLTASAAFFDAGHVGAFFKMHGGYVTVDAFTSSTVVDMTVVDTLSATTATLVWSEGAWSSYRGFPRTISIFEQRLLFGGNANQPQTLWASVSGDYEDMTAGTDDADAYIYTIGSNTVSTIEWISPNQRLLIGTSGGEFSLGTGDGAPVTPTNVQIRPESSFGSSNNVQVSEVKSAAVYVQRSTRKLMAMSYAPDSASYQSIELSLLAEHLGRENGQYFSEISYQQAPDSVIWVRRNDGTLVGLTYNPEQDVLGWHRHTIGGDFAGDGITAGVVISMATIPDDTNGSYETWLAVKRTIDGSTVVHIEYFDSWAHVSATEFNQWDQLNTDAALLYSGASTTSITGLDHLEGETVKVLVDGAVHPDKTVASGAITLDYAGTEVEVGLDYQSAVTLLRPEVQGDTGTAQGKQKGWARIMVRFVDTLGATIEGDIINFRSSADEMDQAPELFTGDKFKSNLGYDNEGKITIEQTQPLPQTITLVSGILHVND